jgi:hypothetical protein
MRNSVTSLKWPLLALSGASFIPNHARDVAYWHLADNPAAPRLSAFGPSTKSLRSCRPLQRAIAQRFSAMTHQRHWLCTAAMVLMPVSAPIKVLV